MLNKKEKNLFFSLSLIMGIVVIVSNYLVQFPVKFYNLENLLTYGAFSYPVTFLITDLANRAFGKKRARQVVFVGFIIGIILTLFLSTNFDDIISIRIAIGSATAFIIAQNFDVNIFDILRKRELPIYLSCIFRHFCTFNRKVWDKNVKKKDIQNNDSVPVFCLPLKFDKWNKK